MTLAMYFVVGLVGATSPTPASMDCLAGVCLGDPGPEAPGPVRVAGRIWYRTTEICSGVVVNIEIETGWSSFHEGRPNWPNRGLPERFYTEWFASDEPKTYYDEIHKSLTGLGWDLTLLRDVDSKVPYGRAYVRGHTDSLAKHPDRYGGRYTFFSYAVASLTPRPYKEASVSVRSTHLDYDALCASKRQEGL